MEQVIFFRLFHVKLSYTDDILGDAQCVDLKELRKNIPARLTIVTVQER